MKPYSISDLEADIRAAMDDGDWPRVETLGADMDNAETTPRAASLPGAALWYAQQGLRVFPLQPLTKKPYPGSRGFKDATADAATVRDWWARRPDANIGIAAGHRVDVIDIDGPTGVVSYARELLDDTGGWLGPPILGRVSTPRPGGHHIYVAADPDRRNSAGLLPGIDTRATGGYVVAPPSVLDDRDGQHPGTYVWTTPLDLAAEAAA